MTNEVVLVDEKDNTLGVMEKLEAHIQGKLHRAFSIFIINSQNEILIHQRAKEKYHGANLWTNACCSHPALGEDVRASAQRRLMEEMGLDCSIEKLFNFNYYAQVENGLIEHELDHVFVGYSDATPYPDASEVQSWKWMSKEYLLQDIQQHPERYTSWFKIALPMLLEQIEIKTEAC
jgi:isopentenyl-diphosphate delta-isomerase